MDVGDTIFCSGCCGAWSIRCRPRPCVCSCDDDDDDDDDTKAAAITVPTEG